MCRKFYGVLFPDSIRPVRMPQIEGKLLNCPAWRGCSSVAVLSQLNTSRAGCSGCSVHGILRCIISRLDSASDNGAEQGQTVELPLLVGGQQRLRYQLQLQSYTPAKPGAVAVVCRKFYGVSFPDLIRLEVCRRSRANC